MSTEPDSSPRTGVSFSNEVEEASPVIQRRATNEELRSAKDRASLSQSAKAWDLDGDGELDDAELALKAMDKSHKGTLSKDQMYKLMSDNLQTQRELFKAKKVVMGLVFFTCILAISNLGTSLAAAFLAKDTKSEGDKLVDATSGRTLKTDTTATVFTVDPEFDKQFSRRHRHLCELTTTGKGGNAVTSAECDIINFIAVSLADGQAIIDACDTGGTVVVRKLSGSGSGHIDHTICPIATPLAGQYTGGGNGNNASPPGLAIKNGSVTKVNIQPTPDETAYTITGLTGAQCTVDSECAVNHVCESNVCKGTDGATCRLHLEGDETDCADNHSCPVGNLDAQEAIVSACACTSDDACTGEEVCAPATCGFLPNAQPSCQTQADLDACCVDFNGANFVFDPTAQYSPYCVQQVEGELATLGATCSATSECALNHVCEESVCKGTDGATCVVGGTDCADYHSCPTGYQDAQPGVITFSACSCDSDLACEDGEVCAAAQCGFLPDLGKSCQTQEDLDACCVSFGAGSEFDSDAQSCV